MMIKVLLTNPQVPSSRNQKQWIVDFFLSTSLHCAVRGSDCLLAIPKYRLYQLFTKTISPIARKFPQLKLFRLRAHSLSNPSNQTIALREFSSPHLSHSTNYHFNHDKVNSWKKGHSVIYMKNDMLALQMCVKKACVLCLIHRPIT